MVEILERLVGVWQAGVYITQIQSNNPMATSRSQTSSSTTQDLSPAIRRRWCFFPTASKTSFYFILSYFMKFKEG